MDTPNNFNMITKMHGWWYS